MAYTSIRFMNAQNELVARGSHTKYVSRMPSFIVRANAFTRYIAIAWKDPDGQNIVDELKEEKS